MLETLEDLWQSVVDGLTKLAGEDAWLEARFWGAYTNMSRLPDAAPIGFITSYLGALGMMPLILFVALSSVWSLAKVGPARKSLTTFFILVLGVPLYPILVAVLLAIVWFVLGVAGIALSILGPIFLISFWSAHLCAWQQDFVKSQRRVRGATEDISCMHLLLALLIGILSLCTVGIVVFVITLLKCPVLLISGFCQAWWHAGRAWLKLVQCPCCYRKERVLLDADDSDSDDDSRAWVWWGWFPLVLAAWLVFVALGVCVAFLVVVLSALVKLLTSAIWPAYVTSGWLRSFGSSGTRRRDASCGVALCQGLKAGYQVLWASDVLTNIFIIGDLTLLNKTTEQFLELAKGQRQELDPECRRLSCLPPVVVGLFQSSWDLAAVAIAEKLGVGKDEVEEAWRSLARQMIRIGREAIENDLLTKDWVEEIPAELVVGLPARALLDTLERSPKEGEIILSSGLVLRSDDRPKGEFFDTIWANLIEARRARWAVRLTEDARENLCAALLAGGGEADALPDCLSAAVKTFEKMPKKTHDECQAILRPLVAISVECSRKSAFKDKLQLAMEGITAEDGAAYLEVVDWNNSDAEAVETSASSESSEGT